MQRPASLPGVESWTIAPCSPAHTPHQWQPIDLSPDGKSLANAGQDGIVRLIDTVTGKAEQLFVGHDAPLAAVVFSPDGKLVASLDSVAGNVRVWLTATGRQMHSVYAGRGNWGAALYWSPDGATLAICIYGNPVKLLDFASGEFLPQPLGHGSVADADGFAWSPDGRRFVCNTAANFRIWDTKALEPVVTLESSAVEYNAPYAWSPDGSTLTQYSPSGEIRIWDPASGKLLQKLKVEHPTLAHIAWLPDSKRALLSTVLPSGAQLWDFSAGKPIGDVLRFGINIFGLALSANGETVAIASEGSIGVFNLASRGLVHEFRTGQWAAESATWSPNGHELAVTGDDTAVWSNGRTRGLAMLPTGSLLNADWLPDGEAILNSHGHLYRRRGSHWDVAHLPLDLRDTRGRMMVALSPDGKRLASLPMPDGVKKFGPEIWDLASAKRLVETEPLAPHVNALAWSPDGTMLAAGADYGDSAIYDAATGKRLWELPGKARIRSLAFSPDGKTLAAGYGGNGNGFVRLYDAGSLVASVANAPHAVRRAEDGPPGPSSNERDGLGRPSSDNAVGGTTGVVDGTSSTDTTRNTTESDATRPHPSPLPKGEGADESNPKSKIEKPKSSAPTTLTLLRELPCNSGPQDPEIAALRWSADGRTLQVLDRAAVYIFDATTGDLLAQAPRLDRTPHDARPANFSPDGRYLAVATTCTRVWDLAELNAAAEQSRKSKVESPKSEEQGTGNRAQGTENPKSKIQNPKLHLVASVVPLGHGQAVVVSADGHWLGTRGAEKEIVYVIQTAAGQETLTPREFYKRFGWKNDPSKVVLPE